MIERDYRQGPIRVRCDGCLVHHPEDGWLARDDALEALQADGWSRRYCGPGHGWCDFCPTCPTKLPWARGKAA